MPLTHGRYIDCGWRDFGTSMNLGDSGGIWPLGVVVVFVVVFVCVMALRGGQARRKDAVDRPL